MGTDTSKNGDGADSSGCGISNARRGTTGIQALDLLGEKFVGPGTLLPALSTRNWRSTAAREIPLCERGKRRAK